MKKRTMSSAAVGDSIIAWTRADISAIHRAAVVAKEKVAVGKQCHHLPEGCANEYGIAPKLHVLLGNRLCRAAHLHVRPIAFINPVGGVSAGAIAVTAASTTARPAIIATAAALVVVLSLTCAMSVIEVQIITSANRCRPILLRFCITIPKIGPDQRVEQS